MAGSEQAAVSTDPTSAGRREAGKAERRARIIRAARELIRETGDAGLSMRALAARAGVSLATPYNLFGSKRAVVLAVLQDVKEFQDRFEALRSADPLERIFGALEIGLGYYVRDPAFYKVMWSAVFDTTDEVRSAIYNEKRDAFWKRLIGDAATAGVLSADVDPALLLRSLDMQFRAVMLDWVLGDLSDRRVGPSVAYGYALILHGAASADWRGPLRVRMLDAQARLEACRSDSVDDHPPDHTPF